MRIGRIKKGKTNMIIDILVKYSGLEKMYIKAGIRGVRNRMRWVLVRLNISAVRFSFLGKILK